MTKKKTHCDLFEEWWSEGAREADWQEQIMKTGTKTLRDLAETVFMQGIWVGRSER